MDKTFFEVEENTEPSGPLVDVNIPEGQQVTLGPSSTPLAFRIQGNQLFLNVTPDYEVQTAGPGGVGPGGAWGRQNPWDPCREGFLGVLKALCPPGSDQPLLGPKAWLRADARGQGPWRTKLPGSPVRSGLSKDDGDLGRVPASLALCPPLGDENSVL